MTAWQCPKCAAPANGHGKEIDDPECKRGAFGDGGRGCAGFLCECDGSIDDDHGTIKDPCYDAHCYHCGWAGTFPKARAVVRDFTDLKPRLALDNEEIKALMFALRTLKTDANPALPDIYAKLQAALGGDDQS